MLKNAKRPGDEDASLRTARASFLRRAHPNPPTSVPRRRTTLGSGTGSGLRATQIISQKVGYV
jgi:hypothetical protein